MVRIKMYPAKKGDAFLVSFGADQDRNILIDMGFVDTYQQHIKQDLIDLNNQGRCIDLLVITHVDQDHIQGAIKFFEENGCTNNIIKVKEVWHNSYRHIQLDKSSNKLSCDETEILEEIKLQNQVDFRTGVEGASVKQGSTLAALLYKNKVNWNGSFDNLAVNKDNKNEVSISDIKLRLITPSSSNLIDLSTKWVDYLESCKYKFQLSDDEIFDDAYELFIQHNTVIEYDNLNSSKSEKKINLTDLLIDNSKHIDKSETNGSSISFIVEYEKLKLLFLGDAHEGDIYRELSKLANENYELNFDVVKVSHHGSRNNTSNRFIKLINSKIFLISTCGEKHPDLETLAKIMTANYPKKIITNYEHPKIIDLKRINASENFKCEFLVDNNIII
ncbi:competence protein ComEC [Vibrio crassostreae]|nr:competence protein ComEC [Vibrio crassostreae]CAK1712645.1 competence protein ComEC [Vibrio crassostreae]CAK2533652.1 competence protein ComEC [Vibrio crassostreae]CAK2541283.1 competence protein ComEC [Vibrio crassostreae]CAK2596392.1 competence protein ComEC [Vibrio crassostreae]